MRGVVIRLDFLTSATSTADLNISWKRHGQTYRGNWCQGGVRGISRSCRELLSISNSHTQLQARREL